MGRGIMLIRTFPVKVMNNERKILIHHKIIDHIAEEIAQIIKIVDSSEVTAARSLIRSFI